MNEHKQLGMGYVSEIEMQCLPEVAPPSFGQSCSKEMREREWFLALEFEQKSNGNLRAKFGKRE
jgi:hypothetical protein